MNGAGTRMAMGAKILRRRCICQARAERRCNAISRRSPRRMMLVFRRSVRASVVVDATRLLLNAAEGGDAYSRHRATGTTLNDLYEIPAVQAR